MLTIAEKLGFMKARTVKDLHKYGDYKQSVVQKFDLSYKSARKLPQKRKILIVQVEFGKTINIERTELCFVNS